MHEFGRLSLVVPNGIDCDKFYPDETAQTSKLHLISNGIQVMQTFCSGSDSLLQLSATYTKSVLLVGNPALPLKGFDRALQVLMAVNQVSGRISDDLG